MVQVIRSARGWSDVSSPSAALRRASTRAVPERRLVFFIGGPMNGRSAVIPFVDGDLCTYEEMTPRVVMDGSRSYVEPVSAAIRYEQYAMHRISTDGRHVAVHLSLELVHLVDDREVADDQTSVEAAQLLRRSLRARLSRFGGWVLPAVVGHEDIVIEFLRENPDEPTGSAPRVLRGHCWLVTPAAGGSGRPRS